LKMSMIQFVVCAILSGIAALAFVAPTTAKLIAAAIPILYSGIFSGGVGYTLQMVAQKFTDPTVASLLLSLEAVFGVLGGWLILNEVMTPREVLGCAVVFAAIILVQIPLPEKKRG
ncbi:MAG: DMT family transporter, partial [Eubacteriales bacterium]|nr:DMT family transporter [Eubacteriales bacterium]